MAKVFISYSHKDSDKKESLLTHLRVLETAGTLSRIELWEDTMIGLGEAWRKEIEDALERADIAVLLVTEHFLTSDFILHEEVRLLLERHKKSRDLYIVPLIASPCDWQAHRWLADLQVFHNGRPIWEDGVNHVATDLAEVAGKVRDHVLRPPTEHATGNRYAHIVYLSPDDGEDGARSVDPSRLLEIVRAELQARAGAAQEGGETPAHEGDALNLTSYATGGGAVVATFDKPDALLRFLLAAPAGLRGRGVERLRMALHSESVGEETRLDASGFPGRGVEVARRVTWLGRDGHILASREAGQFYRKMVDVRAAAGVEFAELFHPVPGRELRPGTVVEVYSLRLEGAGSAAPPRQKVPERVLCGLKFPRTVKEQRPARIKMCFRPGVPFVKVRFDSVDQKESRVAITNPAKPPVEPLTWVFDDFDGGDQREQVFKFDLVNRAGNPLLVLHASFFDEFDERIAETVERPVRLRKYYTTWLWDIFRFSPWYVKAAAALVVLAVVYYLLPLCRKEQIKLSLYWPEPYRLEKDYTENFLKNDKDLPQRWKPFGGGVNVVDGFAGNLNLNGALRVSGGQRILYNPADLQGRDFYDYKVSFKLKFGRGARKAGWVFRAQPDGRSGYVFTLERTAEGYLTLTGELYDGSGKPQPLGQPQPRPVPGGKCCDDDNDVIIVRAEITEFTIRHWIQVVPAAANQTAQPEQPVTPDFEAPGVRFRHGGVGFSEPADNVIDVESWLVKEVGYHCPATAPAPSPAPAARTEPAPPNPDEARAAERPQT